MAIKQHWYENAVFYEVSVRSFYDSNGDGIGDLKGLIEKLDYFTQLGVDCLWLLPIYASPLKDDGYDISDFCQIHSDLGSLQDFDELVSSAHQRGLRIIMDLVMNHTSADHTWFKTGRVDKRSPYHDYYVWSVDPKKYADARIIFIDTETSNWTWNETTKEYYWHRFYSSQPDLNYENPSVIEEMKRVIHFWLQKGIDGFRVDAVPYLVEQEGTNCENLPKTHAILQEIRRYVDEISQDKLLLCEANQWPNDVVEYFGDGKEFQMAFNFPIMPRMFMALKKANAAPIRWALEQLPQIPGGCQWGTFLRNHDELTLEMVSPEERTFMWENYSPDSRYRLNLGIRRRLSPLLENDRRKLELMTALLFSLPGSPFIYYGDEIGMGDNVELFDRNGLRTPMQWQSGPNAGFTNAEKAFIPLIADPLYKPESINVAAQINAPDSLWQFYHHLIKIFKENSQKVSQTFKWIETDHAEIAAFSRGDLPGQILVVANLSDKTLEFSTPSPGSKFTSAIDLLTGKTFQIHSSTLSLPLPAYSCFWLSLY
ncbi:MAG: maltose alpha-D-glucosyltransferase [Anaerolineaceae bacterium]|nr:maltose alpha-D-glucosyltransferase [Anaerolineaceae bacterium]